MEEELRMTFQVGMVGTDGFLLASDTQWTHSPLLYNNSWAGGRHRFNSPKIRINHERGIAVSLARSMETAGHIANEIISSLKDEDFDYPIIPIEQIGATALRSAAQNRDDAECLVGFIRPTPQMFLFQFGTINGQWGPFCQKMSSIAIAGDNLNSAIYWPERYYEKRPIEKLVPLAAHTIGAAQKRNTATISGLEIVLCTASGIRRLSDESIHELELKAVEWDESIGELFLGHREELTYAPNAAG
jgi:hypothetical protein